MEVGRSGRRFLLTGILGRLRDAVTVGVMWEQREWRTQDRNYDPEPTLLTPPSATNKDRTSMQIP